MDAPNVPRIRTLKPEHKVHRKVGPLSDRAYRLWVGLITEADDEGRLVGDVAQLRALIFPYHPMTRARLEAAVAELAATGLIQRYVCQGIPYVSFPSWRDHQKQDAQHFRPSKLPSPPILPPQSDNGATTEAHESLDGDDTTGKGTGPGREGKGREREAPAAPGAPAFQIPESIEKALTRAPTLGAIPSLHRPAFWRAQIRAHPQVDFPAELLKAEAWITANPSKAPKKDFPRFLHTWFERTAERLAP